MFYEKTVLPNGITVITETMSAVRSVAIGIWSAVGSRDETAQQAGMSHFMEHMMFKGTPTRSARDISEHFEQMGAELNAFTTKEYTCYYARILDQHVDDAVEVLSDMVQSSLLATDAITSEREVVIEEIARYEDTPEDMIHELFSSTLMPDHPLGLPVLGQRATVGAFDHDLSASFKASHYGSGNIVVAAAGNIEHATLVELVKRHLDLPVAERAVRAESRPTAERHLEVMRKDTEQAHICWGVLGLEARSEDRFVLSILDSVLGGSMASRLFTEIRENRGLAYAVYSYNALHQDTGQFVVYAGTRPANAEQVVGLIEAEADKMVAHGITSEELYRAKEGLKGHLVLSLESTRSHMTRLGKNEMMQIDSLSVDEIIARIDTITTSQVHELAQRLFETPRTLAMIAPLDAGDIAAAFKS